MEANHWVRPQDTKPPFMTSIPLLVGTLFHSYTKCRKKLWSRVYLDWFDRQPRMDDAEGTDLKRRDTRSLMQGLLKEWCNG